MAPTKPALAFVVALAFVAGGVIGWTIRGPFGLARPPPSARPPAPTSEPSLENDAAALLRSVREARSSVGEIEKSVAELERAQFEEPPLDDALLESEAKRARSMSERFHHLVMALPDDRVRVFLDHVWSARRAAIESRGIALSAEQREGLDRAFVERWLHFREWARTDFRRTPADGALLANAVGRTLAQIRDDARALLGDALFERVAPFL